VERVNKEGRWCHVRIIRRFVIVGPMVSIRLVKGPAPHAFHNFIRSFYKIKSK
jgi:hypothetical protein